MSAIQVPRLQLAANFSQGDKVEWESSGDRNARGVIQRVERDGTIDVPGADFTVEGTEDDPAALIEVMEPGSEGHTPTGDMAAHKFSALSSTDFDVAETEASAPVRRPIVLRSTHEPGDEIAKLRRRQEGVLTFRSASQASVHEPTETELAKINEISSVDLSADEVVVFEDFAASNEQMEKRPMRLTESALRRLETRYQRGRQFRAGHDEKQRVGATFDAEVTEENVNGHDALWLRTKSYAVRNEATTPRRRQLIQDMKTGVLQYTSIGAQGGRWDTVGLDGEGRDPIIEISHDPDAEKPLEATELSRVDLGAVEEAQAIR